MLEAYGAWGEKSMYGRKFMGVIRKTFLIDGDGRIVRIWPKVSVPGHAEEVLEAAARHMRNPRNRLLCSGIYAAERRGFPVS